VKGGGGGGGKKKKEKKTLRHSSPWIRGIFFNVVCVRRIRCVKHTQEGFPDAPVRINPGKGHDSHHH